MAQKSNPKKTLADDPRYAQAVQNYEAGLRALQEHKFEKAKGHLSKVVGGTAKDLSDRASVHLSTCNQHLEKVVNQFKSPEEHFDYAVSLMNVGDYVAASEHLDKLQKQSPKADYVVYGFAASDCLTGHIEDALRHLDEAIRINPSIRGSKRATIPISRTWRKIRASLSCCIPILVLTHSLSTRRSRAIRRRDGTAAFVRAGPTRSHSAAGGRYWGRNRPFHSSQRSRKIRDCSWPASEYQQI